MKNLIRFIFLACMLISFMPASAQRALAAPVRKTVLVLFPLEFTLPGYPTYVLAMQAIQSEFGQAADLNLDVYVEYLDLSRFPGEAYQQQLLSLYAVKYGQKPIDLVLVNNEMALTWWLKYRATIAPGAPVVFYDVATDRLPALQFPPDVTGVTGMADYVTTVNWVRRALPAVKEIVLVHGVGQADQVPAALFPVQALQAALRGQIQFTDLSNLPLPEIKQRVAALPQTSIVLYSVMFEDAAGVKYRPIDVAREVAAASNVPVLSGYDQLIGTGTVGGNMYSIEQQTHDAARLGLRLLRGEAVSALPVVSSQSNRFVFDHLALQRFGIPLSALPPDSIVKNRQYSLWERYQPEIIAAGAAFAVLSLLVVFLLVVTRQLKQTEKTLRQSEEKYRSIFENALEGIFQSTSQGRFLHVNPALVKMFGYTSAEEMVSDITNIGQQIYAHPEDREKIIALLEKDSIIRDYEIECQRKDGSLFWVSDNMYTVRDPNGAILYFEGALLDITERKRAEEALRASHQLLERTLSSLRDAVFIIDAETVVITDCNPAATEIFGYSREEMLGRPTTFLHVDQAALDEFRKHLSAAMAEKEFLFLLGFKMKRKDGTVFPTEHTVMPLKDEQGRQIGWVSVVRDITERKQAETALREAQQLYENIFRLSPEAIVVTTAAEGRYLAANDAHERITGYRLDELIGHPVTEFQVWDTPAGRQKKLQRLLEQGVVRNMEERFPCKSGEFYTALYSAALVEISGERCLISVITDITERKQAEEALQRYAERLQILHEIDQAILGLQSPEDIVQAALHHVRRLIPYQRASVALFEVETSEAVVILAISITGDAVLASKGTRIPLNVFRFTESPPYLPRLVDDITTLADPAQIEKQLLAEGIRSFVNVPLVFHNKVIGALNLGKTTRGVFAAEYVDIATEIASQLAIAIEQARLREQIQRHAAELEQRVAERTAELEQQYHRQAVLEERQRLARDLHDSVTQTLFSMTLTAEATRILLTQDPSRIPAQLDCLHELTQEALAEMRSLVHQLRSTTAERGGLVPTLRQHIVERQTQDGLPVTLNVTGEKQLSSEYEEALFRIVQEGLNNVVKHAQAQQAWVTLRLTDEVVILLIEDDGVGFDPSTTLGTELSPAPVTGEAHFGLAIMRERAKMLDGSFTVEARPGTGTRIRVEIPLMEEGRTYAQPE